MIKVKFNDYLFSVVVIAGLVILLIKPKKSSKNVAIIDLSILLDIRIYDVINTKFLNFDLIIPSFLIDELKNIAKSSNSVKP
ncbi:MAG: hypothetical protein LBS29_02400 [Endomicrobium sp.]|nr:hypothetical protein [Endomicrobium sp.]